MKKLSITHLLMILILVVTLVEYLNVMDNLTKQQNKSNELQQKIDALRTTSSSKNISTPSPTSAMNQSDLEAHFPAPQDYRRWLGIETINKDTARIDNPFFKYKVTYPANKYNVDITSWAEVVIMNPSNQGMFVEILASKTKDFPTPSNEDRQGYNTDRASTSTKTSIAGVEATKYTYDTLAFDYYIFSKNGMNYSVRVGDNEKEKSETETVLKGIALD
jgi:hypothetical protein